jgi:hypothetical protein
MLKRLLLVLALALPLGAAGRILIVADEFPAMELLAAKIKAATGAESTIVAQTDIPADFASYPVLIVYIHKNIGEPAELKFIEFAKQGGNLILLHHSISSGKRQNKQWFPFLGIELPTTPFEQGGYKYYEGIRLEVVNLAAGHPVTTNKVVYDRKVQFEGKPYPGFELDDTEVYLNHRLTTPKTELLGLKFADAKTGKLFEQRTAGWFERAGKGSVFYFMAGHSKADFENPAYSQIVINAASRPSAH